MRGALEHGRPECGARYKTTVLAGRVDVGDLGIKIVGLLWLLHSLAFVVAAAGAWRQASWWPTLTMAVALLSLALCLVEWPEAKLGVPINVVMVVVLLAGAQAGWSFVRV